MPDPITTSALLITVASKSFEEISASLAKSFLAGISDKISKRYELLTTNFKPHLKATYERCTKLKTILKKDEPIELVTHYVDLNFRCANIQYTNEKAISEIRQRKKAIIFGTGGTGKTVFMKYLWLTYFYEHEGKIPIFIELRRLNDLTSENLVSYIRTSLAGAHADVSEEIFSEMIRKSKFVFMLDGFDELNVDKRQRVERQILELANNNPNCAIVVSSRPDDRLRAWQAFSIFEVQPLGKKQAIELIQKIFYEPEIKRKFIERIKEDLYDTHTSFLENPLLATMMLMTFDQFADLPKKVHLFYEQAFETLFLRHDAVKEAFQRQMHTNYSMDVFKRYFALFCLVSYFDERFDFTEKEIKEYLAKGFAIENVQVDVEAFLKDLQDSVCIIQRDGLQFTFSHRSFQEFFAAYAISFLPRNRVRRILDHFSAREGDTAISMLFDMNQELVESEFVLPFVDEITEKLKSIREDDAVAGFVDVMRLEISMENVFRGNESTWFSRSGECYDRIFFLRNLYPVELSELSYTAKKYDLADAKAAKKMFSNAKVPAKTSKKSYLRIAIMSIATADGPRLIRTPVFEVESRFMHNEKSLVGASLPVDPEWVSSTGFAQFFLDASEILFKLKGSIKKKRTLKAKTLDQMFGPH